ncbi:trigger factor family protein, partial [Anaerococcus murdochii]
VLTFEISQDLIQPELTRTFNKVKKNISVPGFRKGKISRQVFNKMYGEAALYEDTLNALLPAAYEAAIEEVGIDPVSQPQLN